MSAIVVSPLPGAGLLHRFLVFLRAVFSRRVLLRLAGIPTVILEGRVIAVRAVPLGVAPELVPAIIRCGRSFGAWNIDEALYDDFVKVLALGLRCPPAAIERLTSPLWSLVPVIELIAQVNGLPTVEAGRADLGKLLATLMNSTGTDSSRGLSATPAGPGSTSNNV